MADDVGWETCREPDCFGARLPGAQVCWAHASPAERDRPIAALEHTGEIDARGVRFDRTTLEPLLDAHSRRPDTRISPRFDKAVFADAADFSSVSFGIRASFNDAEFQAAATFERADFEADAHFEGAILTGPATFDGATFHGKAAFRSAAFHGPAEFAGEREVTFHDWADFQGARFRHRAWFGGARFHSRTMFEEMACDEELRMDGAVFLGARTFGPVRARIVTLDRARFHDPVRIALDCEQLFLVATQFHGRSALQIRRAELVMNEVEFARPSLLTGEDAPEGAAAADQPRVVSLRRANIGELTMAGVDLRACRFVGAHNLDGMRVESDCLFPEPPSSGRYTPRITIADEHAWRANAGSRDWGGTRVEPPGWAVPDLLPRGPALAQQVAATYRDLRKGREDQSDAPGAADFYYGEMEMRRHADPRGGSPAGRRSPLGERTLLGAYWLVSGYGLRAGRALAALALTVLVFAWLLWAWGFDQQPSFWRALLFSAESTASLFRVPEEPQLTTVGEAIQLPLRLLGPLFFGLALLSLRGRVKR